MPRCGRYKADGLARIVLPPDAAVRWFDGEPAVDAGGNTLFAVIRALDARGPGFGAVARRRYVFAVDGMLAADWSTPVRPDSEVLVVIKVAGG